MKTILYIAMTVNGKIASADDDTSWTSKEDWDGFRAMCRPRLKLLGVKILSNRQTVQLHYQVFK